MTFNGKTYRYQVYVPADHTSKRPWPVVINLHGNGAQGPDGLLPTAFGMATDIRMNRARYPAVVLFPQAESGKRWLDGDMEELIIAELDRTMSEFNGDPSRVYLTGFSMGATGAYRIAYRWPTRFAAIVAIAGRVDTSNAQTYSDRDKQADRAANPFVAAADPFAALAERIRVLPIRIVHGDADETVPVEQSRRMLAALEAAKSDVQYEEYKGATHTGAADKGLRRSETDGMAFHAASMRSPIEHLAPVTISVRPLTPDLWPALEDLFGKGGASNGCWCMYWRLGPEYHKRSREKNRKALRSIVEHGPPPGLIAFDGEKPVGWCQLTPRHDLDWLNRKPAFAPVDALPVWSISCFYVRRGYRGRGVMSALIGAAVKAARRDRAPALEAYPVDTAKSGTGNIFTGTAAAFRRLGFKTVARREPSRPIMRHDLKKFV